MVPGAHWSVETAWLSDQDDADNSLVALCQQHSVTFDVNLPAYQLRVLSGEDEVDRWTNQTIWDAALKNIRIVISSYAVLLDALSHGFVTMERLALCIFDEGMFRGNRFGNRLFNVMPKHIIA